MDCADVDGHLVLHRYRVHGSVYSKYKIIMDSRFWIMGIQTWPRDVSSIITRVLYGEACGGWRTIRDLHHAGPLAEFQQ